MDSTSEIWKTIAGWPGYEVSDQGRVRSVDRVLPQKPEKICTIDGCSRPQRRNNVCNTHSTQLKCGYQITVLEPHPPCAFDGCSRQASEGEYCYGHASQKGQMKPLGWRPGKLLSGNMLTIGYLVVTLRDNGKTKTRYIHHLVAETFIGPRPDGMEVRHLNDIKTDNRLVNLTYGTRTENCQDRLRNGINFNAAKTACCRGHEYTQETMRWITSSSTGKPTRLCLICENIRRQRYKHKKNTR